MLNDRRGEMNGSALEQVFDDPLVWTFNVSDGWIYYCNRNDKCLYRIRTDGTEKHKICDDLAYEMSVVGEWIYYKADVLTAGGGAEHMQYRIKADGTMREELGTRDESYNADVQPAPVIDDPESGRTGSKAPDGLDFSLFAGTYSIDLFPAPVRWVRRLLSSRDHIG